MPTEITQIDDTDRLATVLRVKGDMMIDDARLLKRIGDDIRSQTGHRILIDIADLDLLDSESAPFLRSLNEREGFEIEGIEIFLQKAIDQAERSDERPAD